MINDFDLTPDEIKQQYPEDVVKKADTFETHGVSVEAAENYLLDTPEGELYLKRVREADPATALKSPDKLFARAIDQLTSGRELPKMEVINEPLVKIVPKGTAPSSVSPFWTTETELNKAIAEGKNLSKHFGLPIASESQQYDVYRITPKQPTEVFVSHVARTIELKGANTVFKQGGAVQHIVPN